MKVILSPAKKMKVDTDSFAFRDLPQFLPQTEQLLNRLRSLPYEELKTLWKCSDQIAKQNVERLRAMDLRRTLTPALLAYEGIQYQYMAPNVFQWEELDYAQDHLRILSGFYGLLRPFDGVTPYRLEMQAKLSIGQAKSLYEYWGKRISKTLFSETDCVINLASKEYSRCVSPYLTDEVRFVTCVFGEWKEGKVVEKGTMCKMARGEMVRYMAQRRLERPEELKQFSRLGYHFHPERSDDNVYVFIKEEN